jgi:hypothetical protein
VKLEPIRPHSQSGQSSYFRFYVAPLYTVRGGQLPSLKKRIPKPDLSKYDPSPLYLYTEKDSLNRVTVLKETAKDIYLIAGRYSGVEGDARLYTPLTDEEKGEIERNLRGSHKDALINHL